MIALLVAQAAVSTFAPALDRPITYSVEEVRDERGRIQRFAIERQVTFRRSPTGFTADVTTLSVTGTTGGAGALFEAMTRSMVDRRVIIQLNRSGAAIDVDDLDAVWDLQLAGMTRALTSKGPERAAMVDNLLAPLRTMPRAAKVKRIGEMIAPLIAERPFAPTPLRTITVPARSQGGASTLLAGTERITEQTDRSLLLVRHARGAIGGVATSVVLRRRIEPRTGLVPETVSTETIDTADARLIVTRTIVIAR